MSEVNPNKLDLVLGGQNPPPLDAAILGGLAGARQRLASESIAERLQGLSNTVHYGKEGIDLAITALKDDDISVQNLASKLLRYHFGVAGEEALYEHAAYTIEDHYDPFNRRSEVYDPRIGIRDPEDITYIVKIKDSSNFNKKIESHIESLVEDSNISSLRSTIVELDFLLMYQWIRGEHLISELMYPILMTNAVPSLKSLGIDYKCDDYSNPRIDEEVVQKAMNGTFELVFNSRVTRKNLKYLSVKMPNNQMSEYITAETVNNSRRSVPYKSFDIIKNMRVNFW